MIKVGFEEGDRAAVSGGEGGEGEVRLREGQRTVGRDAQRDEEESAHQIAVDRGIGVPGKDELEGENDDLDHCVDDK